MSFIIKPNRFTNLHGHSCVGSPGDALDLPDKHIDWAIKNGSDSMALTDHGNMQGVSFFKLHEQKVNKAGKKFKGLPGIEGYFIDSLSKWRELYDADKLEKRKSEIAKAKSKSKAVNAFSDDMSKTEEDLAAINEDLVSAPDEEETTSVENEEESKSNKWSNPLYQRNHIVLLPKNSAGLKSIFRIVTESNIDGFYKYPRIDFDMLRKYSNGNIIAISACIAGRLSRVIFDHQAEKDHTLWMPNDTNKELIQSELSDVIGQFKDALGEENYFIELQANRLGQQHLSNYHLIEASKRTNTKLVMTCDSHYADPAHWKEREIYKAMAWATKTKGEVDLTKIPQSISDIKCELYPKNQDQMWDSYIRYCKEVYPEVYHDDELIKDAIERTHDIAHQMIGDVKFDTTVKYPSMTKLIDKDRLEILRSKFADASEDDLVFKELVDRCIKGMRFRKKNHDDKYIDRLKNELNVIKHLNMQKYFLTYAKILEVVTNHMITGAGRGSAAGSLVLYVLNITQIDPIKYGLLFERMLTIHKVGAVDIDLDYADRELALKLITDHFGSGAVVPVTNFNQLKLKSLIKDLSRMYSLPFEEINKATFEIEKEAREAARKQEDFDAGTWVLTFEEAVKYSPTFNRLIEQYPVLESSIKVLFKQVRGLSTHASGVGIYTGNQDEMPIIKFGNKFQTPWPEGQNYRHLESFGVLKYDVLGLGTLRMFEKCIERIIKKQTGKNAVPFAEIAKWYYENVHPDNNNLDDLAVYKNIFWNSNEVGTFQWIADNVKKFTSELKPRTIEDLSMITATFRPGPLDAGVDKLLLRNRTDIEEARASLPHPALEQVLAETNYVLIYQEQIQLIFNKLAGVPIDKTDDVRKAFTKRDLSNLEKSAAERNRLREEFAKGCDEHSKIKKEEAYKIFDYMEQYVRYSFNKAHSVCYACVAYQCAWLQHYYQDEWVATYIDYCTSDKGKAAGKEDPKMVAIKEAKMLGYKISKADINKSDYEFIIDTENKKTLVPSFSSMKYVGKTVTTELKDYRPYTSVRDLIVNKDGTWRHTKFNKRALTTLIKLEALGSMDIVGEGKQFKNYKQLYSVLIDKFDEFKRITNRKKNNDITQLLEKAIEDVQSMEDWTKKEKLEFTKDLAGSVDISLIVPPEAHAKLESLGFESIDNWCEKGNYWGIVAGATKAITKTNKEYVKLRLFGELNKEYNCFIWGWKGEINVQENDVIVGLIDSSSFGFSCFQNKLFKIN
jgi:DNA polymerase-3 subunit alpha